MNPGRFDPAVLAAVSRAPAVAKMTRRRAMEVVKLARKKAPKDTGAGRRSIQVKRRINKKTKAAEHHVSWDSQHFYMVMQNNGATLKNGGRIKAQHFLEAAAEEIQGQGEQR